MDKLGALDANFLYSETDNVKNHVATVQVMQLPEGAEPQAFIASLKLFIGNRVHLVPYLHRKVREVPGRLDHPVWVHDTHFDINNHVFEVAVDAPGGQDEIDACVAQLHAVRMDVTKPLWNLYVLTGLPDNQVAYYYQTHHAAIDGVSGQLAIQRLFDESYDHPDISPPEGFALEENASLSGLMADTWANLLRFQVDAASRYLGSLESSHRMLQRMVNPGLGLGALAQPAPRTRFNDNVAPERSWVSTSLPIADLKQVAKPMGCTLNDAFLAVCGGALRRYLSRRGELPAESLVAACPVSLHEPGDRSFGNKVTMMLVELATDETAPLTRLLRVHQSAETAKGVTADMAAGYDPDVSLPGLPAVMTSMARLGELSGIASQLTPVSNVVISNVPGPRKPLFSNGAEMLTHYPVSLVTHGQGLNITVQSYCDEMFVGITACADALPDAKLLRDDLLAAFAELRACLEPAQIADFRIVNEPGPEAPVASQVA